MLFTCELGSRVGVTYTNIIEDAILHVISNGITVEIDLSKYFGHYRRDSK
jgi:hypothetical protein